MDCIITFFTSEFKYYNIKLDEICNIVENKQLEHKQKYGVDYHRIVKVKCVAEFWDKIENDIKIITIHSCNINDELNKLTCSSEGMLILIRIDKLRILIERIVF